MLHSELEAFLDLAALNADSQALHHLPPADARQAFERATQRLRWPAPTDLHVQDLSMPVRDGTRLPVRLYRPAGQEQARLPVLVYFHGGGFVVGSLQSHDGVCRELSARAGLAVLAVGYRLAPEHRFPTAFEDGEDALRWLAGAAPDLALSLDGVVLGGDSAGATIAATLAIQAAREGAAAPVAIAAQLLCYPVTDARDAHVSRTLFGEGYLLESETLEWFYHTFARVPEDRGDWRFSPLHAPDLSGVAPAVVLLAGLDPLLDEGRAYVARLQASGVEVASIEVADLTHDMLRMTSVVPQVSAVYDRLVTELSTVLRTAQPA